MKLMFKEEVKIPADVPESFHDIYVENYLAATQRTGRLMMFAGDQKIEHLNDDFYDNDQSREISEEDHCPEHLFHIASQAQIGVFAAQLGLISQYGRDFPDINYLVKLNSKSNLVTLNQHEPLSQALWNIEDVVNLKATSHLNIVGIGYTIYLGSEHETQMFTEAARLIKDAHRHGLMSCIWMYPRGKAVEDEKDAHLIAGAAGVAVCLGADFVKVNMPHDDNNQYTAKALQEATWAAGRTGVICAGGSSTSAEDFLQQLHDQIHIGGARGNATGRNIHQRSLLEAVRLCDAISSITLGNHNVEFAKQVYNGNAQFKFD